MQKNVLSQVFNSPFVTVGTAIPDAALPLNRARRLLDKGPQMTDRLVKRAEDTLDYFLDLNSWLEPGESLTGAWASTSDETLDIPRVNFAPSGVVVWVSSGADNVQYLVQVLVTTSLGKFKLTPFQFVTNGLALDIPIVAVDGDDEAVIEQPEIIPPVNPALPTATLTPATLTFATTMVGQVTATQAITVKNTGTVNLNMRQIKATGDFSYTSNATATVKPNESFTLNVKFAPTASGARAGAIMMDIGNGVVQFATLAGTGQVVTPGLSALSTVGNQIQDAYSQPVRLKSINWFGAEGTNFTPHGTWVRPWKAVIDQIAAWGFNCIRFPFSGDFTTAGRTVPQTALSASANPDLLNLSALAIMDLYVAYAATKNIYIVFDHHRRTAGDGADGTPIDATYTLESWKASWAVMANRYKNAVNVIGADLHNEPHSLDWPTWAGYAEQCADSIHLIAPNWLMIVEGVESFAGDSYWWGGQLAGVASRPVVLSRPHKVVYSPHDYGQSVGVQSWLAYDGQAAPANWPNNLYSVFKAHWGFIFEQNIAPVWVGEFGGKFGVDGNGVVNQPNGTLETVWAAQLVKYLNGDFTGTGVIGLPSGKVGMSFAYFAVNPNSVDTGGLLRDDWTTTQATKLAIINPLLAG